MRALQNRFTWGVAILIVVMLSLCVAHATFAQTAAFATITGRALDPGGAAVPNATVTATNTETGIARKTQTTTDGLYRLENLPPGIYDVAIEAAGFTKAEAKSVKLQVGEQRDVNFNLSLAGQKQSVVVTSELPLIEATKTDVSTVIDDKAVSELPTTTSFNAIGGVANDYQGLAASAPGVRYDYSGDSSDIVGPGAVSDRGVTVNIDGGNISDQVVSSRDALGASLEEVKEFQVLTNNYNAEYGQAGNIILNVITKSGTNSVHGDWHSYFRGRNLGSSNWFYNTGFASATPANPEGCPLSDFGSGGTLTTLSGCPRAPFFKHENGFTVGGPFVKDRIFWFASWEKVAQGSPFTTTPFGQAVTVNAPTDEILWSAKLDAKLTEKHSLTIRYNVQRDVSGNELVQTGGNTAPSGFVSSAVHDAGFNVALVSTPTPSTVNEARFFWHRYLSLTPTASTAPGQALPSAYVGADFCCPQGAYQNRFQYLDNVSYTRGTHTFKVGANISHFPYQSIFQQYHYGEYSNFNSSACAPFSACPTTFTVGAGPGFVQAADNIYGAFAQDTWQIRRNLTLNYGVRYDKEDGAFRGGTIFTSTVKGGCLQSNGQIPACGSDNNNWQPRLGIAWTPNYSSGILHKIFGDPGKSVIRASAAEVTEMAYLNVVLDSLNFDGKTLLTATVNAADCFLPNGTVNPTPSAVDAQSCAVLDAYPNTPSAASLLPFTGGGGGFFGRVRPISPTIKNPEIHMAALTYQRQLGSAFTYSIGYQGDFAHGLFGETDTNFPTPVADPAHPGFFYFPGVPGTVSGNDRPNPAFGAVRTNFSNRSSGYNSLVLTAEKRLTKHFQFTGSYTWSKTISNGEDFFGLSEPANPLAPLSQETALAQQDIRHLANFNFVADSNNIFHTPIVKQALNNWTFGLLGTLQSGRPYPVSTGDGVFAGDNFPALGSETNQRPNICEPGATVAGCAGQAPGTLVSTNIGSISGSNYEVSPAGVTACVTAGIASCPTATTFVAPAGASTHGPVDSIGCQNSSGVFGPCGTAFPNAVPVDFQYISGNLARNVGQSLPLYRFDISLSKAIKIPKWESASLELKFEAFNVFNHPLFILNNSNDVLNFFSLPKLMVTNAAGNLVPNPNYNCTASCINPFTGLYLGADGKALTISDFQRATVNSAANFSNLGAPSAVVTPRILQLAVRFRW